MKSLRLKIWNSVNSEKTETFSPLCLLKQVFKDIGLSSVKKNYLIDLKYFFRVFYDTYSEIFIIENVMDAVLLLFHWLFNSKNHNSCSINLENILKLDTKEIYECDCGLKFVNQIQDSYFISIDINNDQDLINSRFFDILAKNMSNKVYKFCKNSYCPLKTSKKSLIFCKPTEYIIFKINWNTSPIITNTSISLNFKQKETSNENQEENYELFLILASSVISFIFFYENSIWYNFENKAEFTFDELITTIIREKYKIELLIYKKTTKPQVFEETKSRIAISTLLKYSTQKTLNNKWICKKCQRKNSAENKFCIICLTIKPNEDGWVCVNCKKYHSNSIDECEACNSYKNKKTHLSEKNCLCCGFSIKTGATCTNCSAILRKTGLLANSLKDLKIENSLHSRTVSHSCKECKKHLSSPFYCSNCLNKIIGFNHCLCNDSKFYYCYECVEKVCKKCKNKLESGRCKKCSENMRPRSAKPILACCKCGRSLVSAEFKNCGKCNKTSTENNFCSYCKIVIQKKFHICSSCMKKNKKL